MAKLVEWATWYNTKGMVAKLEGWVAKWYRMQTSLKNHIWATWAQSSSPIKF